MPDGLDPVIEALRGMFGTSTALPGLAPGLVVPDTRGWWPASALPGELLDGWLAGAQRTWPGSVAAAAALAWKSYVYWLTLPAILGWALHDRFPLISAGNTVVRLTGSGVRIGLRPGTPMASGTDHLREALLDDHLTPLLDALHRTTRVGRRTLLGSVASAVTYPLQRTGTGAKADGLLADLGVRDLVEADGTAWRRRTCCLAFTLPRPRVCPDCCIKEARTS
jgi:ferric iron reductase protein FhuF